MTRDECNRILMQMERLRHDAMEAESVAEQRRLNREYGALWRIVEPHLAQYEGPNDIHGAVSLKADDSQ